jgi:signal transduction histidine kinase
VVSDGVVALAAAGLSLAEMRGYADPRDRSALNVGFVLLQTLPLVVRRRAPFTVFAVGATALGIQGSLWLHGPTFAFLAVNLALYSLAAYGEDRLAIFGASAWALLLTGRLAHLVGTTWPDLRIADLYDVVDDYVLLAAAWILGRGIRQRRLQAAELEGRAARLEREREEKARQAATQERLRIARELHDVVAHSLSVIGMQAGSRSTGARLGSGAEPRGSHLHRSHREPRHGRDAPSPGHTPRHRAVRGIAVSASGTTRDPFPPRRGEEGRTPGGAHRARRPAALATSIDLSLYRIVQESLTHALKHARASRAHVVIRYAEHDVEVEVADDGVGSSLSPQRAEGTGTIGMRERVALFRGTLWFGPRSQGGYAVRVSLPVSAEEP